MKPAPIIFTASLLFATTAHIGVFHQLGTTKSSEIKIKGASVSVSLVANTAPPSTAPEISAPLPSTQAAPPKPRPKTPIPKVTKAKAPAAHKTPKPPVETETPKPANPTTPPPATQASAASTPQASTTQQHPTAATTTREADPSVTRTASRSGSTAPSTKTNETVGNSESENYGGKVMRHLSRKKRPRASGPGAAQIRFSLDRNGRTNTVEVTRTSGSTRFDRDAIRFVKKAAPFPKPPSLFVNRTFEVEIKGR